MSATRYPQPALTVEEAVQMHNLLLRLGPFTLYERWIKAQPPEICAAIQAFETEGAKEARAQALAAANPVTVNQPRFELGLLSLPRYHGVTT